MDGSDPRVIIRDPRYAPRNLTVMAVLIVCMPSVAGALFLVLEMDRPFDGIMQVSSTPLKAALARLGE